jgi:hypothetical protein
MSSYTNLFDITQETHINDGILFIQASHIQFIHNYMLFLHFTSLCTQPMYRRFKTQKMQFVLLCFKYKSLMAYYPLQQKRNTKKIVQNFDSLLEH